MEGRRFQGIEVINKDATAELIAVSLDPFGDNFVRKTYKVYCSQRRSPGTLLFELV